MYFAGFEELKDVVAFFSELDRDNWVEYQDIYSIENEETAENADFHRVKLSQEEGEAVIFDSGYIASVDPVNNRQIWFNA